MFWNFWYWFGSTNYYEFSQFFNMFLNELGFAKCVNLTKIWKFQNIIYTYFTFKMMIPLVIKIRKIFWIQVCWKCTYRKRSQNYSRSSRTIVGDYETTSNPDNIRATSGFVAMIMEWLQINSSNMEIIGDKSIWIYKYLWNHGWHSNFFRWMTMKPLEACLVSLGQ